MNNSLGLSVRGKKRAYLRAYADCGRLDKAAQRLKVHRNTHYYWMNTDPQYKHDYELAKEMAADNIEAALYERGVEGVEKPTGWYKGEPGGVLVIDDHLGGYRYSLHFSNGINNDWFEWNCIARE